MGSYNHDWQWTLKRIKTLYFRTLQRIRTLSLRRIRMLSLRTLVPISMTLQV